MGEIRPMPQRGDVFSDIRGDDRTMRVSYHHDRGVVVVSLWAGLVCRGSFRMAATEVDRLISALGEMRIAVDAATPAAGPPAAGQPQAPAGPAASAEAGTAQTGATEAGAPGPEDRPGPVHFGPAPVVLRPQVA
jgi:hypothetical protein